MNNEFFPQDAENAVLSLVIKNSDLAYNTDGLRPKMFSSSAYQILFSKIEDLKSANTVIDPIILTSYLESDGTLAKFGGKEFLTYLISLDHPKENFHEFVRIVIESFKARTTQGILTSYGQGEINAGNVNSVIADVKAGLDSLYNESSHNSISPISELVAPYYSDLLERIKNPGIRGTSWGIHDIDLITGGKSPGELWIIAARPSQGKTSFICNAALYDGLHGIPNLIISREMTYRELLERFLPIYTGIPNTNLRLGMVNQEQLEKIAEALKEFKKLPIYIDTNFNGNDELYIESTIRKYNSLYGVKDVYLDYLQLLVERDDGATHGLGRMTRMLKKTANALDVCNVAASQLNREVEHRDNKRPVLSDIRQSGNIEEDADFVGGIYRPWIYTKEEKDRELMEFILLKARNGPIGTIPVRFIDNTNKIVGAD